MKQKNSKKYVVLSSILIIILFLLLCFICLFLYFMSPVGGNKKVDFIVNDGDTSRDIATNLEKKGIIKNRTFFLAYLFITNNRNIYVAKYNLNSNMKTSKIVSVLAHEGKDINEITLTFKEGLNMRDIAKLISDNTNNSVDDVIKTSRDSKYLDSVISKYWFLDKNIKNNKLFYNLEGFLFPDTYNFSSKNVSVSEIFDVMLENTDKHLAKYKDQMVKEKKSAFNVITMASILELEGTNYDARCDIAGVFNNRLKKKMSLGSDVTTYYDVKKSMTSDLYDSELSGNNGYNTRAIGMEGKLPIGPICNPSIDSIKAVLNPSKHNYYYFVADKNGKVYLTKTYATHNKVIKDLKNKGLWLEW